MGFFQTFKQMFTGEKASSKLEEGMKPLEESTCPYCEHTFEKPLSRKKKCSECNNDVYVRTLPYKEGEKKVRVATTDAQAENIDIQWAKLNGNYEDLMEERKKYEQMKRKLLKDWGKEPSESDIEWHLMMGSRIDYANKNQWGMYRNVTLSQAEHLYKLKKYELSLRTYLEVLYLDLNGPKNVALINGQYSTKEKAFNPSNGNDFVAPGIVKRIVILKDKRIPMDDKQVKELFLDECKQVHGTLQTPLNPNEAWEKFTQDDLFWK